MADGKYGRLFTEAEVRGLIALAASDALRGVAETLRVDQYAARLIEEIAAPTFPPDEPLFLLRGKDLAAHGGAWSYAYEASRVGASVEFVTEALRHANDLRDWAEENPNRMKVPD